MNPKLRQLRQFVVNKATGKNRIMMQCRTVINKDAVSRQSIDGIEHILVSSATLPDDVVMNRILYPAAEIKKSFESLENTHAPIEHPEDSDGNFMSASDPRAIPNFYAGAMNVNVRRENGRVYIDKLINVSEAQKSDKGKRLLDRINELETNPKPRPIHTSVGLFLTLKELDKPLTNAEGDEYFGIAENMVFDHDAILLDSVGAAQPDQGVGMAVNKAGKKHKVQKFNLSDDESVSDRRKAVSDALEESPYEFSWISEDGLFEDKVIYWADACCEDLFEVPYVVDSNGIATIVGIPIPVERIVTYVPKTNSEGDAMNELIVNALKEAKIETEGLSDEQLLVEYNKLQANQSDDNSESESEHADDKGELATVMAKALKPLEDRLDSFETNQNAATTAQIDELAEIVGNSDKYAGIDAEDAKKLGLDKLKEMAANCGTSYGLTPSINNSSANESLQAPAEMVA